MQHFATRLTCEYRPSALGIDSSAPRFSWWMHDDRPGAAQTGRRIQVAATPAFDAGELVWESGEVEGSDSVLVEYGGEPLRSRARYWWRVRIRDNHEEWSEWSEPAWFETAFLSQEEWKASWIAPDDESRVAPFMRREFALAEPVAEARLYVSARGLAELHLNGRRVGDDVLSPGWTDFDFRTQYITYDVTDLVGEGRNAVGAILGDGWYSGRIAKVKDRDPRFGSRPQLLCELHVRTVGGAEHAIVSDGAWTWAPGPIVESDIYDGETYDARRELAGWDAADVAADRDAASGAASTPGAAASAGADPTPWRPVRLVGPASAAWDGTVVTESANARAGDEHGFGADAGVWPGSDPARSGRRAPRLDAKLVPPPRRVLEITPVGRTEPEPGRHVFDLGQNISGWARVRLAGRAGNPITLRFAEMLQADGTLYVENLRSARATDVFIPRADGTFEWEPRFTFHGFRYVEVSGIDAAPALDAVTGVVIHNDLELTGSFECSSPLVNQLQSNIVWGQRGNYLEAPTDCPQRDERLGWTGDAQVFIPTAAFNMQVAPFFAKWQRDLADAQGPRGTIPSIAPAIRYMKPADANDGGPAWSDAVVICPWTVRRRYGDRRIIAEHYESIFRFIESMRERSRGLIRSDEFVVDWGGYGDWVSMDAPEGERVGATPKDLIGTAYFAYSTHLACRMAQELGHSHDVVYLRDLHRRIVDAFRREYVTSGGRLLGDTQTAYAVALAFDLLPEELQQGAVDRLVRLLEKRTWRLSTGFVGTPLLCPVLTRFGRVDVAYRLLLQEAFPSWLYTVNQGATTMWERWNSYTHEHGFGPVEMNSFNHYAYGSIGDWIYTSVAGLSVDTSVTGEAPIRLAPHPGYGLSSARAELVTPFGPASSGWQIDDNRVRLDVSIPANAWARLEIDADWSDIEIDAEEGEAHLEDLVVHEESEAGRFVFRVAAGSYAFSWPLPKAAR